MVKSAVSPIANPSTGHIATMTSLSSTPDVTSKHTFSNGWLSLILTLVLMNPTLITAGEIIIAL